jgi:hypothetical protein
LKCKSNEIIGVFLLRLIKPTSVDFKLPILR